MDLPFIDEHTLLVSAPPDAVWQRVTKLFGRTPGANVLASVLGTQPRRASGAMPDKGATLPGFKVAEAAPGQRLKLTGGHRFSRYALTMTLTEQPGGTVLSARTNAEFPGVTGFLYRQLVITSGAHRLVVSRMLDRVRRRAEAASGL